MSLLSLLSAIFGDPINDPRWVTACGLTHPTTSVNHKRHSGAAQIKRAALKRRNRRKHRG